MISDFNPFLIGKKQNHFQKFGTPVRVESY